MNEVMYLGEGGCPDGSRTTWDVDLTVRRLRHLSATSMGEAVRAAGIDAAQA
jgi:hypothetical protein